MMANNDMSRWCVLYTAPKSERKLVQRLHAAGYMAFCPMQIVFKKWKGQTKEVFAPLFPDCVFVEEAAAKAEPSGSPVSVNKKYNIAVAGTGYVGLSLATLLAQHNHVTAVDIIPEKVELINHKKSPIQDEYIEKYLAEKELDLTATTDGVSCISGCRFRHHRCTHQL